MVLATGLFAAGQPAPAQNLKENPLPGAKLLHKFPDQVYRIPVLLDTQQGPRLLVWVDSFDPAPVPKIPSEPLPQPKFDLVIWDVAVGKEIDKMTCPKEDAPLTPVAPSSMAVSVVFGYDTFGALAYSPDAKFLAWQFTSYQMVPGKIVHEATTQIRLYDPSTRQWKPAISTLFKGHPRPSLLFAPDGALVILKDATCTVQELGKPQPRKVFALARAPGFAKAPGLYDFREAVVSPDGSRLAVAADGLVTVYDLATGQVVLQAERAVPDAKSTFGQITGKVSLAFPPAANEQTLLAVEMTTGPPKSFVLARLFDLKNKKETVRKILAEEKTQAGPFGPQALPNWGRAYAYFNSKGEPRILFDGRLFDAASGKALHQGDGGAGLNLSRDGKYLVRLTRKMGSKTMGVELWGLDNSQ
jgi:hypothetical protein